MDTKEIVQTVEHRPFPLPAEPWVEPHYLVERSPRELGI